MSWSVLNRSPDVFLHLSQDRIHRSSIRRWNRTSKTNDVWPKEEEEVNKQNGQAEELDGTVSQRPVWENSPLDACHEPSRQEDAAIGHHLAKLAVRSLIRHSLCGFASLLPNSFYGLFSRWIHEMNPKDLGDVPSGLPSYLLWSLFLCHDVFWSFRGSGAFLPPILEPFPSWPSASPSILHP